MKWLYYALAGAFLLIPLSFAHAQEFIDFTDTVLQGNTFELKIPQYNIQKAVGSINDDQTIHFYELEREPRDHEIISRAEFLELIYLNANVEPGDTVASFPDVPSDNPYQESIHRAAGSEIIHGFPDGLFRPYNPLTRGQAAKILVNAFDPPVRTEHAAPGFPDIKQNHPLYAYVMHAVSAGVFRGYPDGLMRPNRHINFSEAETIVKRILKKDELQSLGVRKYWRALIGFHRLKDQGIRSINVNLYKDDGKLEQRSFEVNVLKRDYPVQRFSMDYDRVALFSAKDQEQTWAAVDGAREKSSEKQLWEGPFIRPTTGRITLGFGDILYINGRYRGSHFGIDYADITGTPVNASNNGIVTLAEYTPSFGYTVMLDHGHNVFTMYIHLSELTTEVGKTVQKGETVGLMGNTGISTGSHLHFTQFIGDIVVDTTEWFEDRF